MAIAIYFKGGINAKTIEPFPIGSVPFQSGGIGSGLPTGVVIIANNETPIIPNIGSLTLQPGGAVDGSPSGGFLGAINTYVGVGPGFVGPPDGIHFSATHGGNLTFPDGIFQQKMSVLLSSVNNPTVSVLVQISTSDDVLPTDGPPGGPVGPPTGIYGPSSLTAAWEHDEIDDLFFVRLNWIDNSTNETGFAIERSSDNGVSWSQVGMAPAGFTSYGDYGVTSNSDMYRVYSFNDTVRSVESNIASPDFTITSISPNQSLIGFNPTIIITGTGFGTALATQITSVHFRSRFNPIYSADATSITPIDNTHISVVVPNAPNGSEYVDVVIENLHGDTDTLLGGYHYNIQFEWTLEDPFTPVVPGSKVKFSSDNAISISPDTLGSSSSSASSEVDPDSKTNSDGFSNNPGFDGVVEIQLQAVGSDLPIIIVPHYNIIIQTPIKLWFYVPIGFKTFTGPVTIILVGDGIQFYGSVIAGQLQILYEDATGIYTLVQDQTNDLLYTRNGYITNIASFISPNITEDELYENDAFGMMPYPYKMLTQDDSNEDFESGDFFMTLNLQFPVLVSAEIPSPFVRTSFLP